MSGGELQYPPGYQPGGPGGPLQGAMPQRGVFATSEVLPLLAEASRRMDELAANWKRLRTEANEKTPYAKKVRADLTVSLRTWGNDVTGQPIKTSAERNEWANADADVQQAELEAELAQTVQMHAREVYNDAQSYYETLRQMSAIERDEQRREHGGGPAPGHSGPQHGQGYGRPF